MPDTKNSYDFLSKPLGIAWVFAGLLLLLAFLYFPAAKAGFVADYTGWLDQTLRYGFLDNINRTHYHGQSLYQFTQFNTWVLYQLFGTQPLLWHGLFITMHAVNACLLYKLCNNLLHDVEVGKRGFISLSGAVLFCVSPHISEVIVWEPSFHFLQGLMLTLLILNQSHEYICTGKEKHAFIAGILYLLSSFSLEIFYITPWLLLSMAFFLQTQSCLQATILQQNDNEYFYSPAYCLCNAHHLIPDHLWQLDSPYRL